MSRKTFCDICHKEIAGGNPYRANVIHVGPGVYFSGSTHQESLLDYDFCRTCWEKIVQVAKRIHSEKVGEDE